MRENVIPMLRGGATDGRTDEELVRACAEGDTCALAALFDRHHSTLHRYLHALAGVDWPVVDDLVQDTFIEVARSAPGFRGEARVRTWLLGIATNRARHHVRAEVRLGARLRRFFENSEQKAAPSPHDALVRNERLSRLRRAMEGLSHDLREAFVLCDIEGERGVDAARILSIPEGTLYRRLHNARRRLRVAVREGEP